MPNFILDHLHIWSAAPEAAAQAYVRFFAAEVIERSRTANGERITVRVAGQVLFIEQSGSEACSFQPLGLEHFAVATDAFDDVVANLRACGAEFLTEPKLARPGRRIAFVAMPDGGRVELVEVCENRN